MCCVSTDNDNNFEIEKPIISIRKDYKSQLDSRQTDESFIQNNAYNKVDITNCPYAEIDVVSAHIDVVNKLVHPIVVFTFNGKVMQTTPQSQNNHTIIWNESFRLEPIL
jgi:hypothetical protein